MENERRRYFREMVNSGINTPNVYVEGESVEVKDFSTGGLHILSEKPLDLKKVHITINPNDKEKKLKLTGHVIRVTQEGKMWGIAIDLSKQYIIKKS